MVSSDILSPEERTALQARVLRLYPELERDNIALGVAEYVRFLMLKVTWNDTDALKLSPSPPIDLIWHEHILDTGAYARCCERLGVFLHHSPDLALDAAARDQRYTLTYLALPSLSRTNYRNWWPLPHALATVIDENKEPREEDEPVSHEYAPKDPDPPVAQRKKRGRQDDEVAEPVKTKRARVVKPLKITVKSLTGKSMDFHLAPSELILGLMQAIFAREGIPVDQQVLIINKERYRGTDLERPEHPPVALEHAGVVGDTVMHLILNLAGC